MKNVFSIDSVIAALGWAGAAISLGSYILVSTGRLQATSVTYQSLVLSSATALAISCAFTGAWPSFLTNLVFCLIGIITIAVVAGRRVDLGALVRGTVVHATELAGMMLRRLSHATGMDRETRRHRPVRPSRPVVSLQRDEIDELFETPEETGFEIAVVAYGAK